MKLISKEFKLEFLSAGDKLKPCLIFFHGFPDLPSSWNNQLEFFSKDYFCLAPYCLGTGSFNYQDSEEFLQRLIRFIHQNEILVSGVVGHDLGSCLAWKFVESVPVPLIIINGFEQSQYFSRLKNLDQVKKSWYMACFQVPKLPELFIKNFHNTFERIAFSKDAPKIIERPSSKEIARGIKFYRELLREGLLSKRKNKIKNLLQFAGTLDPYLEIPTQKELKKISQNFEIRVLDAGHWLHQSKPDQVNRLMSRFLSSLIFENEVRC